MKRDIEFISTKPTKLISSNDLIYNKPFLSILFILIPILTLGFILYENKKKKKNSDITYVKYKKATKIALKRLKKAKQHLQKKQKDEFYTEISQATWNYLSDRFKIEKMELSFDNVKDILNQKQLKEETINNLISLLNNCEYVRFSQGEELSKMDNLYEQAINTLSDIESQIK